MKYRELTLGQVEAIGNKLGGETGIAKFLSGDLVVVAKSTANKLLEYVTTVTTTAFKQFVAKDFFKLGVTDGVNITYLGETFKKVLLSGKGKIEKNVEACDIRVHKLTRSSRDLAIRYEIGEDNGETNLATLWSFLKLQGTKGGWFIFYIRDDEGILWAVSACWFGDGWDVDVYSVAYRDGWRPGSCVCSR